MSANKIRQPIGLSRGNGKIDRPYSMARKKYKSVGRCVTATWLGRYACATSALWLHCFGGGLPRPVRTCAECPVHCTSSARILKRVRQVKPYPILNFGLSRGTLPRPFNRIHFLETLRSLGKSEGSWSGLLVRKLDSRTPGGSKQ